MRDSVVTELECNVQLLKQGAVDQRQSVHGIASLIAQTGAAVDYESVVQVIKRQY